MYERNILIVDDDIRVKTLYISKYKLEAEKLRLAEQKYSNYKLNFLYAESIDEAIKLLESNQIIDVLISDYRFNNATSRSNGIDLVDYIRKNVNKHCKVIFYTMNQITDILHEELVKLSNNHIFRIVDKATVDSDQFIRVIYEASVDCEIVVTAIERFWNQYEEVFKNYEYTFDGKSEKFEDIITHIRMDDEIGQSIINKLLHKALLESIDY